MFYNLRLVDKIQEYHLNRCKSNFVLNKSEPLVLINSDNTNSNHITPCTSNGTHAIGCLFEHRFLHILMNIAHVLMHKW